MGNNVHNITFYTSRYIDNTGYEIYPLFGINDSGNSNPHMKFQTNLIINQIHGDSIVHMGSRSI